MRAGLFGNAGRMAGGMMADKIGRGMKNQTQARLPQEEPQPRRGLFGGARSMLGNVGGFLQSERGGVSNLDRISLIAAMMRDEPSHFTTQQQSLQRQQTLYEQRQQEMQEAQGQRNTQEKQAEQERQRLDGQARALGMDPREFSMLPPEVQSDLLARKYTPEEPDRPSSFEEFSLASENPAYRQFLQANPRGTSVNVNTGAQPDPRPAIGSIPQGFQARFDEQAGSYVYEPIPGSDPERERQGVENAAQEAATRQERYAGIAVDEIRRATDVLNQNPRAGGAMGQVMQNVGGTLSNELDGLYETIGGYIARDTLQGMRDSSPTGGALGQVTERELAMLRAAYGAIRVSDRPETQQYNLARLNNLLLDVTHGEGVGPPRMELPGREQAGGENLTEDERRELQELERRFGGR